MELHFRFLEPKLFLRETQACTNQQSNIALQLAGLAPRFSACSPQADWVAFTRHTHTLGLICFKTPCRDGRLCSREHHRHPPMAAYSLSFR